MRETANNFAQKNLKQKTIKLGTGYTQTNQLKNYLHISEEFHFENISVKIFFFGLGVKLDFRRTEPLLLPPEGHLAEAGIVLRLPRWFLANGR